MLHVSACLEHNTVRMDMKFKKTHVNPNTDKTSDQPKQSHKHKTTHVNPNTDKTSDQPKQPHKQKMTVW